MKANLASLALRVTQKHAVCKVTQLEVYRNNLGYLSCRKKMGAHCCYFFTSSKLNKPSLLVPLIATFYAGILDMP